MPKNAVVPVVFGDNTSSQVIATGAAWGGGSNFFLKNVAGTQVPPATSAQTVTCTQYLYSNISTIVGSSKTIDRKSRLLFSVS